MAKMLALYCFKCFFSFGFIQSFLCQCVKVEGDAQHPDMRSAILKIAHILKHEQSLYFLTPFYGLYWLRLFRLFVIGRTTTTATTTRNHFRFQPCC